MLKHRIGTIAVLSFFLYMLFSPKTVFSGASQGLLLWFQIVLPTLLPYMILINIMIHTPAIHWICHITSSFLCPFLGTSYYGTFAVLTGFLCGYPMGAKTTADLLNAHKISKTEASYLLSFCNNTSPAFILSYIVMQNLKDSSLGIPFLFILIIAPFITGFLFRIFYYHQPMETVPIDFSSTYSSGNLPINFFDQCIMNAFEAITKIGGYMIMFSILIKLISGLLPDHPGTLIICSSLEISTGIKLIASSDLCSKYQIILCAILASFGGWCCIAQTYSMIHESGLPIIPYIAEKLATALVTSLLMSAYIFI